MHRYPKYKDSTVEWLGEIPAHWEVKKLKYVARIHNGMEVPKDSSGEGRIPVYGSGGQFKYTENPIYDGPSVLLGRKGTIDVPILVEGPFWSVDTAFYTKVDAAKISFYLFYYLAQIFPYESLSTKTALPSMTQTALNSLKLPLPPLEEQQQIARYLDAKTQHIDQQIADQEQLIELLKEYRQSLISEVVTKGLNPDAPLKESGVEWLGEIPAHWEVKKLKYVAEVNPKLPLPDDFIYINLESVVSGKFMFSSDLILTKYNAPSRAQRVLKVNDVLFQLVRPYQQNNLFFSMSNSNYVASTGYAQIRTKECAKFIYYVIHNNSFQSTVFTHCTGSTYPAITSNDLSIIPLPLPPLEEQQQIARYLDAKTQHIDQLVHTAQDQIAYLKEYRQSLISEVVTGKRKVADV